MSVKAQAIYNIYKDNIIRIISMIRTKKELAIPGIITELTTNIVPQMMSDVSKMKALSGIEKKTLVIEAIDYAIDDVFQKLNEIPELQEASWDEALHATIDTLLPPLIDLLISVENNDIKFNKKAFSCFPCCK